MAGLILVAIRYVSSRSYGYNDAYSIIQSHSSSSDVIQRPL